MSTAARVCSLVVLWCACAGCGSSEAPPAPGGVPGTASGGGSSSSVRTGNFNPGLAPTAQTCGNGQIDEGEQCDDGNADNADGCNALCQQEADFDCAVPGEPCTTSSICGDGNLSSLEVCDDGNTAAGDGCAADCSAVDPGWQCRVPGKACLALCGDGVVIPGQETCDDSNAASGDGCSSRCQVEPGWSCDPMPCVRSLCGNGVKEAGEACDAGELNGLFFGDSTGCSKTCTQEPGCRDASGLTTVCTPGCGSANIDPGEDCDDGNLLDGDGCSSACIPEGGFICEPETVPDTQLCSTGLGECLVLPITYRDFDGQNLPTGHPDFFYMGANVGGVVTTCVPNASGITPGTNGTCWSTDSTPLCTGLTAATLGPGGKPVAGATQACACRFTDWDDTGVLANAAGVTTCSDSGGYTRQRIEAAVPVIQSAQSFAQWYSDSDFSTKVVSTLELAQIPGTNQFQFSSSGGRSIYDDIHDIFLSGVGRLESGFFPLEDQSRTKICNIWPYWVPGLATSCVAQAGGAVEWQWDPRGWGWLLPAGNVGTPPAIPGGGPVAPVAGVPRNFYFTSEVRYLFRYVGGETLAFYGDDDVWVFINGNLVLDLGAPHERLQGTVTLTAAGGADWVIQSQNIVNGAWADIASGSLAGLGLQPDNTYEIAVFHADRHPRESNYQLTLSGFSTTRSVCVPECGNGIVTAGEECDDGPANQDDLYGGCTLNCTYGPFCGDGVVNGPEECDLGRENGPSYGEDSCTTACTRSHFCGDGIIDSAFGEQCDEGDANGGGVCTDDCTLILL